MTARLLGHLSLRAKLFGAILLLAAAAGGSSAYVAARFVETDEAYSGLVAGEAAGVMLVSRAGINVVEDGRLVLALLSETRPDERARLARERVAAQARAQEALEKTAAALPAEAGRVAALRERFGRVAAKGNAVETALVDGDWPRARALANEVYRPDFAALRVEMRELAAALDARMRAESAALSARAEASARKTLLITGAASLAALLLAALVLRWGLSRPLAELSARMRALAAGDAASPVPGLDRRDEFLAMAAALEGFRLAELERQRLARAANTDALTGLLNRRGALAGVEEAAASGAPLAAIAIDLDHFKRANDDHGHEAGDAVLREAARRILGCVRANDLVCRPGGDEFLVVLPGLAEMEPLQAVALRLREALHLPVLWEGRSLRLGATLGVALGPVPGGAAEEVLRRADDALMGAKRRGARGTVGWAEAAVVVA